MVLSLKLNQFSDVGRSVDTAVRALDSRKDDYDGMSKTIKNISPNTNNLISGNTYLKKKSKQIQDKIDKLKAFKRKVNTFASNAENADKRVASYVKDSSEHFYKTVGIKTGIAGWWENVKRGAKKAWKAVKDFYEKHKYIIDFIKDVAFLVIAVISLIAAIPTGGLSLFFAGFALCNAIGDTVGSSVALFWHLKGDDEKAGVWAERGLKDGFMWVGEKIAGELGAEFFGFLYEGLSFANLVYSIKDLGENLFKSLDLRNTNNLTVSGRLKNAFKELFGFSTFTSDGKGLAKCWQLKSLFGLKSVDTARKIFVGCNFVKNIKTIITITDSIFEGVFFGEGNQIGESISKTIEGIKNLYKHGKNLGPDFLGKLGTGVAIRAITLPVMPIPMCPIPAM